jgi:PAS domain S-box-containing protein
MSVVARILALIAVTLMVVAGVEIHTGVNLRATREAELRGEALQLARIATLDMDRILEGARQLLATLAKLPVAGEWDERACSTISATVNDDFEYDFITAVGRDGRILCSSDRPKGVLVADREVLDRVLAGQGFVIASYGRGKVSGNEIMRIGYPMVDGAGTITGAIYAGVNVTWLNTAIDQWQLPENVVVDIADRNGVLVARHPDAKWVGRELPEALRPVLASGAVGTTEEVGLDGVERLFGYIPADVGPSRGLSVVVGLDRVRAIAEIDRSVWRNVAITIALILASGLAAWIYVRRFIDQPFRRLLHAVARGQDGDWTARARMATGISEFDRLGTAFDAMAEVVAAREDELREGAARLERSEEHLARAQRVAAVGSFEFDLGSGRIEWSDETYRMLGVRRESEPMSYASFIAMIVPSDRETVERAIAIARQGHDVPPAGFDIRRSDGAVRTIEYQIEVKRDATGKPLKLIGVCRDTTELRETERQRDELEAQLRRSQKLEALGTLAGGIAHDLNNALTPVIFLSGMMLEEAPEGSRDRETLGLIDEGGKRARDLVRRMLTFARKDEPKRLRLDVAAVVRNALKLLRASIPATISINERVLPVPPVLADEGQLHQVLANLVYNAAQAIGDGIGAIAVEVAAADGALAGGEAAVRLTVMDNGCGMDEPTRQRVFDPFYTTKSVGEGTGLGLSVVHGIVTAHGGAITVESALGLGSRFDIYLPIAGAARAVLEGEAA